MNKIDYRKANKKQLYAIVIDLDNCKDDRDAALKELMKRKGEPNER